MDSKAGRSMPWEESGFISLKNHQEEYLKRKQKLLEASVAKTKKSRKKKKKTSKVISTAIPPPPPLSDLPINARRRVPTPPPSHSPHNDQVASMKLQLASTESQRQRLLVDYMKLLSEHNALVKSTNQQQQQHLPDCEEAPLEQQRHMLETSIAQVNQERQVFKDREAHLQRIIENLQHVLLQQQNNNNSTDDTTKCSKCPELDAEKTSLFEYARVVESQLQMSEMKRILGNVFKSHRHRVVKPTLYSAMLQWKEETFLYEEVEEEEEDAQQQQQHHDINSTHHPILYRNDDDNLDLLSQLASSEPHHHYKSPADPHEQQVPSFQKVPEDLVYNRHQQQQQLKRRDSDCHQAFITQQFEMIIQTSSVNHRAQIYDTTTTAPRARIEKVAMMMGDNEENEILYADDVTEEFHFEDDTPPLPLSDEEEDDEQLMTTDEDDSSMMMIDNKSRLPLDEPVLTLSKHTGPVYAICQNPTSSNIFATAGGDDVAILWKDNAPVSVLSGHTDSVVAVAFNFDGTLLATGGYDGVVKIWNGEKCVQTLEGPSEEVEWIDWHTKGNVILAGSGDGTVWMWLATSGACMHVFAGHEGRVTTGGFTPSGKMIVTASADSTIRIWNPKTGECVYRSNTSADDSPPVSTLATHSTLPLVLTGAEDGSATLFHLQTKKALQKFRHTTSSNSEGVFSIETVGFSNPAFNYAATACLGGQLRIWDLSSNTCRHVCNHRDGVTKLVWHPSEALVLTVCVDGSAYWWDARSGECVAQKQCHNEMILDVMLSQSNAIPLSFYTASDDHTIRKF